MTKTDFICLMPFLVTAIAPLIIMTFISVLRNYKAVSGISILSLLIAFVSIFFVVPYVPHAMAPLLVIDIYSLFFLGIIILTAILVALISYDYFKTLDGVKEEYYILLFTSTLGAELLVVANHFVAFFLGLEMLSVSLYVLIAYQRSKSGSIEAGFKYLILASASSAFLLFGMALLYTSYGTMEFSGIASAIHNDGPLSPLTLAGFGMMVVGIGFKLALAPFHMWTPDVYQGAPAPVTAFIATVSKGGVMAVLIRFFFYIGGFENQYIFIVISAIAIFTMFTGNLLAVRQQNLKRLLAYSSIANMGYLLIILLTASDKGIQAAIFYLISYFITTIGAFGLISLSSTGEHELEKIEDYKGLFWKNPFAAAVFTLSLLSLAGIPLTAGFIAKFYLVFEGMQAGLMVLVFAMIINSVIGLYYYLRVINALFSPADESKFPQLSFLGRLTLALVAISILILGIYPGWLVEIIGKFVAL